MDYFAPLRSKLKLKILMSLLKGDKKVAEITSDVGARETTILHVLKEFEELNLSTKTSGVYGLTSLGYIDAQICRKCSNSAEVIEKFKDLWLGHDVHSIPANLLLQIGDLKDSTLVRTNVAELSKVHEAFLQILGTSTRVKGISPIFHPDYVPVIQQLLSQGKPVELILTRAVLEKTLQMAEVSGLKENFTENLKNETLRIYLKEDLKLALTVTEKNFSLGLFLENGEYDYDNDLISINPNAIAWGEELFQNFLNGSLKLGMKALG